MPVSASKSPFAKEVKLADPKEGTPLIPVIVSRSDVTPPPSTSRSTFSVESSQPAALPGVEERNNLNRRRVEKSSSRNGNRVAFNTSVTDLRTGSSEPLRTESCQDLRRRAYLAGAKASEGMEFPWTYNAPIGHRVLENYVRGGRGLSLRTNRVIVLVLTFICYAAYHASRKPPSIVKSILHGDGDAAATAMGGHRRALLEASIQNRGFGIVESPVRLRLLQQVEGKSTVTPLTTEGVDFPDGESHFSKNRSIPTKGWAPFNNPKVGKSLLGDLDLSFLGAYALGMFVSGHLGDRVDLRRFLTGGMLGSGVFVALFGAAYFWNIHTMGYFVIVSVCGGLLQATGWPAVVSVMANWFGHGKRGLIMTLWNAHTSIGNIAGSLIAAYMVRYGWGWAFIVPGVLMAVVGIFIFLFLVVEPQDIGFLPQSGSVLGSLIPSQVSTPRGPTGATGVMSDQERALLERRVAQLAEQRGGLVPARVAASLEAHHHLHPPHGKHGMMAMGSTLVLVNERRDSVDGSEDEGEDDRDALLGQSPFSERTGGGTLIQSKNSVSFFAAWCIPGVAVYAFTLFFAKLTAYTFLYWLPYYINSTSVGGRVLTPTEAGNLSILFDVGGVLGGAFAGYLSDVSGAPAIVSCGYVYLAIPVLYLYRAYGALSFPINIGLMTTAGFFVNGPYALITTAVSADLGSGTVAGNEKALATVTAIIDGMGSIGAALGPMLTGYISELRGGFDNVFMMLYGAGFCAGLLLSGLVLRELGEVLGFNAKAGGKHGRGASKQRGDGVASSMADERGLSNGQGLLDAADVINSAQFSYTPPDERQYPMTIDNETGRPGPFPPINKGS